MCRECVGTSRVDVCLGEVWSRFDGVSGMVLCGTTETRQRWLVGWNGKDNDGGGGWGKYYYL